MRRISLLVTALLGALPAACGGSGGDSLFGSGGGGAGSGAAGSSSPGGRAAGATGAGGLDGGGGDAALPDGGGPAGATGAGGAGVAGAAGAGGSPSGGASGGAGGRASGGASGAGGAASDGGPPPGDGGPRPLGAATPGVVTCAGLDCILPGLPTNTCCVGAWPFPTTCLPSFPGCVNGGIASISCDDATDCGGGEICCGTLDGQVLGATCAATCGNFQVCRTTDECTSGSCSPLPEAPAYGRCSP